MSARVRPASIGVVSHALTIGDGHVDSPRSTVRLTESPELGFRVLRRFTGGFSKAFTSYCLVFSKRPQTCFDKDICMGKRKITHSRKRQCCLSWRNESKLRGKNELDRFSSIFLYLSFIHFHLSSSMYAQFTSCWLQAGDMSIPEFVRLLFAFCIYRVDTSRWLPRLSRESGLQWLGTATTLRPRHAHFESPWHDLDSRMPPSCFLSL